MNNRSHYIAGASAFVIWGFFSIPLRAIRDFGVGEILYFRILFAAIVLIVAMAAFKRKDIKKDIATLKALPPEQRNKTIALTLAGGALLIVNWLTFIYIVNNINIKTASFSYMICPVITAVLGYVLLKEQLTRIQWLAVLLCGVSCVLIGISSVLELGYSFLTAFTYALYLVSQRRNQGFDRLVVLGIQMIFASLILNFMSGYLIHEVPGEWRFYWIVLIIAVVFTCLPLFLNLYALNKINSATIGILLYLNPIFNFAIAFIVFKEKIDLTQVVGYVIIIIALVLFNYHTFKRIQNSMSQKLT